MKDDVKSARDRAKAFVLDYLADGPKPTREVKAAAQAAGHSKITLRRVVRDMPVVSRPQKGVGSPWVWRLRRWAAIPPRGSGARREQPNSDAMSALLDPLEPLQHPVGFRPPPD